jgi:hypothetical protein
MNKKITKILIFIISVFSAGVVGSRTPVFNWSLLTGSNSFATSTAVSSVLSSSEVCKYAYIKMTPTAGNVNVTLPTASSLISECLGSVTKKVEFYYVNGATAATSTTIVAGSNIDLESDDSGGDVIAQNGTAEISCYNLDGTNVACTIRPFTDAD